MKREATRQYFQKHCAKQKKSGLTIASYCQKYDIKISQFYYWKKQVETVSRGLSKQTFQKVTLSPTIDPSEKMGLTITLPNGIILNHHSQKCTISELSLLIQELWRSDV